MVALSRELYLHHRPSRQQTMTQHWCDKKRSCHIHFDYRHNIPLKPCTVYLVSRPRTSTPVTPYRPHQQQPVLAVPASRGVLPRPSRGSSTRTRACRPGAGPCSAPRSGGGPRRTSRGLYPGAAPVDQNTGTTAVSIQMKSLLYALNNDSRGTKTGPSNNDHNVVCLRRSTFILHIALMSLIGLHKSLPVGRLRSPHSRQPHTAPHLTSTTAQRTGPLTLAISTSQGPAVSLNVRTAFSARTSRATQRPIASCATWSAKSGITPLYT
jgi:hypothetical protein